MKFKSKLDENYFKIAGITEGEVRKQLKIKPLSKDREKQRNMKNQWRRNKQKFLKSIKRWHNSTQGKRFHRSLGRFNALREEKVHQVGYLSYWYYKRDEDKNKIDKNNGLIALTMDEVLMAMDGLSSIEKHLILELNYLSSDISEYSEFVEFAKLSMDTIKYLYDILFESLKTGYMEQDDYEFLIEFIDIFLDPKAYLYAKREKQGLTNDQTQAPEIKEDLEFIEKLNMTANKSLMIDEYLNIKSQKRKIDG